MTAKILQGLLWTGFHTFHAKDALCSILSCSGVVCDINIHWTDSFALSTGNTLFLIACDTAHRIVAHWLQKYSNRADILAKGSIVLKEKSQHYSHHIIQRIPQKEGVEHHLVPIFDRRKHQNHNKDKGECKGDVTKKANFLSFM